MPRKHSQTPPYVPRTGFRTVLDHIQSFKAGETLDREVLHKRGLSSHLTYPAIAALRFLGLMDDGDKLTGKHAAFSRDSPDKKAQAGIVKEAYSEFFEKATLPAQSTSAIKDSFQQVYDLSDRVVNSAFPLFQYLAQEAGIALTLEGTHAPILEEPRTVRHEVVAGMPPATPEEEAALTTAATAGLPLRVKHTGYQIVINLQVTKYTSEKDLIRMIRTANRAVHLLRKAGDTQ